MKSIVSYYPAAPFKYPRLMRRGEYDVVYLLISPTYGFVVHSTDKSFPIGTETTSVSLNAMVGFDGTVTLQNA